MLTASWLSSILDSIAVPTVGANVLNAAIVVSGAAAAVAGASLYWSQRGGGNLWTGTFDLTKISSIWAGVPSGAIGSAVLSSSTEKNVKVGALGASYTIQDFFPWKIFIAPSSSYNTELRGPDVSEAMMTPGSSSKGTFLGPFVFSTLRFTWPLFLPDNIGWVDLTEGVLGLGLNVGLANKSQDLSKTLKGGGIKGLFDKVKYDPFDFGIIVGGSTPLG